MRSRTVRLVLDVTEKEKEAIEKKVEKSGLLNYAAYARKMLIDGLIIKRDLSDFKTLNAEIEQINRAIILMGSNINQIAKRVNTSENLFDEDLLQIQEHQKNINEKLDQIWQLQKSMLSKLL